jgi:YesN/AraC family two-component response regulator
MELMALDKYLPSVLIVDDNALVRSFLRTALETTARVVEAEDAERALEILETRGRGTVDLVLLDYVLPKRSGLELLKVTKRSWPWISVVILTGFGSEDLAVQAFRGGASDYLRKPIRLDALMQTVAAGLTRAQSAPRGDRPCGDRGVQARAVHPHIHRALAFMHAHFAEPISLSGVAREAGLSRFHFCRLFHHETGTPFHEYLQDLRVTRAKVLLANRYSRVSEVAYAVGFNDLSYFDKTFRRMVGRSPTEYRASLQCA